MSSRISALLVAVVVTLAPSVLAAQSTDAAKLAKANQVQGTAAPTVEVPTLVTTAAAKAAKGNLVQGTAAVTKAETLATVVSDSARAAKLARANRVQGGEAPAQMIVAPNVPTLARRGNAAQGAAAAVTPEVASRP